LVKDKEIISKQVIKNVKDLMGARFS